MSKTGLSGPEPIMNPSNSLHSHAMLNNATLAQLRALKLQGFAYYGLPETEKPLIGFFGHDAIRGIYLHGAKRPDLISPDNLESDFGFMQRPDAVRLNLDLFSIGTLGNSLKQSPIKTGKRSRSS